MKNYFSKALLLLVALPLAWGCSSKEDHPFELWQNYFMVIEGQQSTFPIKYGSGDYDVVPKDPAIVSGGAVSQDKGAGLLAFTGVKPGHTEVTVTDKITDEHLTVTVYVSEPYCAIRGAESVNADVKAAAGKQVPAGLLEELKNNEPFGYYFDFILVQGSDKLFVEISRGSIISLFKGTYEIKGTGTEPLLEIAFKNDEEQEITAQYRLSGSGTQILLAFLNADLSAGGTRLSVAPDYREILLTEDLTTQLSQQYPDITSASRDIYCATRANDWMNRAFITKYY